LNDSAKAERGNCFTVGNASGPRDHLGCIFTFKAVDGSSMNDLVVIGVHLKSGQNLNSIHNGEMQSLSAAFASIFDGNPLPTMERDVVIAGDFNANLYDTKLENFWEDFAGTFDVDVLAPTSFTDYQPTRLAKVPLQPSSYIDYVMASSLAGGVKDDLVRSTAHVHSELLTSPFEDFRRNASDHVPVTIRIKVGVDDD
jgi:endonuclease/exonuclease/phosphatase family metal-dependent hydrolase